MEPPLRVLYFESPEGSVRTATRLATNDERFTVDVATNAATAGDVLGGDGIDCVVVAADRSDRAAILGAVRAADPELPLFVYGSDEPIEGATDVLPEGPDSIERLRDRIVMAVAAYWTPEAVHVRNQVLDAAPVGITLSEASKPDNPLVYVNRKFEEMTGYDATEAVGRNCRFLQGPDTDPDAVAAMRRAINDEEPVAVELRNYRRDGTEFWSRVEIVPLRDDDGAVTNYLGLQRDVTDRVRRERRDDRMREARARLLELVAGNRGGRNDRERAGEPRGGAGGKRPIDDLPAIDEILELGRTALELDGGYLARVDRDRDRHEVTHAVGSPVEAGDVSIVSETFCRFALERTGPFGFHDAADDWATDPAIDAQGIRSYLGTAVRADDATRTICFVGEQPRDGAFTEGERSFVALVASEVGRLLQRAENDAGSDRNVR